MHNKSKLLAVVGTTLAVFALSAPAHAQATRTFVSGVGNDADPCSRTAPCKTFAGAISKTFINGEIDCLDPGGFGTLTITKSITIDCTGTLGSVLASGTNGFNINIAVNANDPFRTVRLRGLTINGTGASGTIGTRTGLKGISITQAATVILEDLVISDFSQQGISDVENHHRRQAHHPEFGDQKQYLGRHRRRRSGHQQRIDRQRSLDQQRLSASPPAPATMSASPARYSPATPRPASKPMPGRRSVMDNSLVSGNATGLQNNGTMVDLQFGDFVQHDGNYRRDHLVRKQPHLRQYLARAPFRPSALASSDHGQQ